MRALLIGAGAVGQVYGRHLQLGGAEVAFLVKPKYAEACRAGMPVYPLNKSAKVDAVRFEAPIFDSLDAALETPWDMIWLCVSSTAIMGAWLDEVVARRGDARIVALQPGLAAVRRIESLIPADEVIWGGISMISYQTPIEGVETRDPGVAYWFPPMGPSPFWGFEEGAREVVKTLKRGGCPAKHNPNGAAQLIYGSAILMPHLVALEAADWSFAKLRQGDGLALASAASREAMALISEETGYPIPAARAVIRPFWMGMLSRVANCVVPLPIEPYLEYHFTKVGDQTRAMMQVYFQLGRDLGKPTEAIEALVRAANIEGLDVPA